MTDSARPAIRVGLIRPLEHCTFAWEMPAQGGLRTAMVTPTHCPECIGELRRLGYSLAGESMDTEPRPGGR
jgi:hypothetical protein